MVFPYDETEVDTLFSDYCNQDWIPISLCSSAVELGALVQQQNKMMRPVDFFPMERCRRASSTGPGSADF